MQDLKNKVQEAAKEEKRQLADRIASQDTRPADDHEAKHTSHSTPSTAQRERKDSSPIKVSHRRAILDQ